MFILPVLKIYVKDGWNSPEFYLVLTEMGEYRFQGVLKSLVVGSSSESLAI